MSDKTAKDWEDRVVLLEQETAQAKARETALSAELAKAKADAASMAGVLEQARAAEKARRDREVAAFVSDLKAKAQPNAISEPDLARVQALFDRGDDENARFVGGLLLKGASVGNAPAGKTVALAPSNLTDKAKETAAYTASQLRAAGFTVELSADGTQITKQTPPPKRAGGR